MGKSCQFSGGCRIYWRYFFRLPKATATGGHGKRFLHFFGGGGVVLHKNVSKNFSNNRFFQAEKLPEKSCQQEEYYRQHNSKPNKSFKLEQIWRRQLHS